jgi:hypothetical protein
VGTADLTDVRADVERARDALRDRIDDVDLEPRIRQAKIGFWTAVRAVVGALVAVPGLVTRGLGSLSDVADDAVERGTELSTRSRRLARSIPVTKAGRRRARARTAAWAAGGFAVGAAAGVVAGYVLGQRRPELADEAWASARATSERAREVAADTVERAREAATDAGPAIRDAAEEGLETAREAAEEAADDAATTVSAAADRVASGNGEAADRSTGR